MCGIMTEEQTKAISDDDIMTQLPREFLKNISSELKPETIIRFRELYQKFPELIDYRIKHGNVYEKAQGILIKSVALDSLRLRSTEKLNGKAPPNL